MAQDKKGDWYIQPAQEIDGTTFAVIRIDNDLFGKLRPVKGARNAAEIYIKTSPYEYQEIKGGFIHVKQAVALGASINEKPGYRRGALVKSGWMASKRHETVIYQADEQAAPIALDDDQIDAYREQLSAEQKKLLGNQGVLTAGQPVFYLPDPDDPLRVTAFGHCRMLRIPYPASPRELTPRNLRENPNPDLAEAIFGFTHNTGSKAARNEEASFAGRVFVSDARVELGQGDLWLAARRTIYPKILGGPKPTTFQHYLVQTQPNRYKVGETRDGKPRFELRLVDYDRDTVIRGSKFYWHKGEAGLEDIQEPDKPKPGDTQHTRIQPLRAGVRFKFRVDFENLCSEELGALLWVLNVAADERYRLKIGMGKPLGMGAVQVKPDLYLYDRRARYQTLFEQNAWQQAARADRRAGEEAVARFERFILENLGCKQEQRLADLERIRDLLRLLSWPGPDPEFTRYLEIEHSDPASKKGKRNEYRDRPVLPTPAAVLAKRAAKRAVSQTAGVARSQEAPPTKGPQTQQSEYLGTVKKFGLGNRQDYGFINYRKADGSVAEIYVNKHALERGLESLTPGQKVIFSISTGERGDRAVRVRLAGK